jgi:hypothetical protein
MMHSKSHLFAPISASVLVAAGFIATLAILCPSTSFAQTSSSSTQSIRAGSREAKNLPKAPSFKTRKERLRAKPLDPKATSGKPRRVRLTKAELQELKNAKPGNSRGGAPNPNAKKAALKQYPNDWKLSR